MYDDFVLVGRRATLPASKVKDVAVALKTIKNKQAPFYRAGIVPAHIAELALWNKDAGIDVETGRSLVQIDWPRHGSDALPRVPVALMADGSRHLDRSKTKVTRHFLWKVTGGCSISSPSSWSIQTSTQM